MRGKTLGAILLIAFALCITFNSYAADNKKKTDPVEISADDIERGTAGFTKTVLYNTYDESDDPMKHFTSDTIEVNGDTYRIKECSAPKRIGIDAVEADEYGYTTEVFNGDENEYLPLEETELEGVKVRLKSKELIDIKSEERTDYKEQELTIHGIEGGADVPETTDIEFTDIDTKQKVIAPLELKDYEVVSEYWSEDFRFPIVCEDYDANVFTLNGKDIPRDAALIEYAADFLTELGLDPDYYKVKSIEWIGEPYTQNNKLIRKALAQGSKYKKDVRAFYAGDVTMPSVQGKAWDCTYEEILDADHQNIYTMATDVTFEIDNRIEGQSLWDKIWETIKGVFKTVYEAVKAFAEEHPVISISLSLILALLILFLITRKRKHTCKYDRNVICQNKKQDKETCLNCIYYHQEH